MWLERNGNENERAQKSLISALHDRYKKEKGHARKEHDPWWGEVDSDHRSRQTTDLQSAPFGRSGIPPYMLELVDGFEPPTC
jgi:hypothetical protein